MTKLTTVTLDFEPAICQRDLDILKGLFSYLLYYAYNQPRKKLVLKDWFVSSYSIPSDEYSSFSYIGKGKKGTSFLLELCFEGKYS